jgi:hypothetical protein
MYAMNQPTTRSMRRYCIGLEATRPGGSRAIALSRDGFGMHLDAMNEGMGEQGTAYWWQKYVNKRDPGSQAWADSSGNPPEIKILESTHTDKGPASAQAIVERE